LNLGTALYDPATGQKLLNHEEEAAARLAAEQARQEAEQARAEEGTIAAISRETTELNIDPDTISRPDNQYQAKSRNVSGNSRELPEAGLAAYSA